jgi:hypothetical protein
MGLALQNYHDVNNGICPATLMNPNPSSASAVNSSVTWGVMLLPYLEQGALYDKLAISGSTYAAVNTNPTNNPATPLGQDSASIQSYLCPSRRSGVNHPTGWSVGNQTNVGGVCGDYASVNCPQTTPAGAIAGVSSANCFNTYPTSASGNPLTMYGGAMLAADRYGSVTTAQGYRSHTTFASMTDGLSNTFMIGEKQISKLDLKDPSNGDGNFWYYDGTIANQRNSVRVIQHPTDSVMWHMQNSLAKKGANEPSGGNGPLAFGSWHPSVVQFVLGDGAVKQIRTNGDKTVMYYVACRNDGFPAEPDGI